MIKNINIIKFRGIENKKIELGERVTILAGKNGTQKSTILGLLGQPFAFYGSKDGVKQELEKGILNENDILTILGHPFETKFSELFKFSPKYELEKEYRYILEFKDGYFEKNKCFMGTKSRLGKNLRFNHYVNENFGTYGVYKDFIYPTIYLGLSRLYPIGESKKLNKDNESCLFNDINLKQEFQENYNKILKQVENFHEEIIEKDIGKTVGIDTGYYDSFGNSSGQDNVGRILASLLSFKKLKSKYKGYKGGLLLIDELDVSLFAASQFTIYDIIEKYAKQLNLQVVFTTHSLELIKYIKDKNKKEDKLYYFTKVDKNINISENPNFKDIYNNICQKIDKKIERNKIKIFTEDKIASKFLKQILKPYLKISLLDIIGLELSWKNMKISNDKFSLDSDIFIYDGDVNTKEIKKNNELKLPLDKALEREMLIYLNQKDASDSIWNEYDFTKNYFENRIINEYKVNFENTESCKNVLKDENFLEEVSKRFFKYWPKENKKLIQKNKDKINIRKKEDVLKLGFSTFYLNRVNRSGIIKAGVIGGTKQTGNYKMDCRFNKKDLIKKIEEIGKYKDRIKFYNLDVIEFLKRIKKKDTFIFFDPPYYEKGKDLYVNFYEDENHRELANRISKLRNDWIVTYDNTNPIKEIYSLYRQIEFNISYTLEKKRKAKEIMIFSNKLEYILEKEE